MKRCPRETSALERCPRERCASWRGEAGSVGARLEEPGWAASWLAAGHAASHLDGPTCSLLTTHYSPRTPHRLPRTTHPALLTTGTHAPPGTVHPTSCSPTTRAARGAWRRPAGARWTRRRWRSCPTARSVVTLTVTVPLTLTLTPTLTLTLHPNPHPHPHPKPGAPHAAPSSRGAPRQGRRDQPRRRRELRTLNLTLTLTQS